MFKILTLVILQASSFMPAYAMAKAETLESLKVKLERWDVEDVWPGVESVLAQKPGDPGALETASHIAYYRGEYEEALRLVRTSLEAGGENEHRRGFARFIEETMAVLAPFKRYETPHFIILLDERQDGILIDYLIDALERTQEVMLKQYGFRPREKVRVELFPDARAFYRASALSIRDIEVTGAVGLAKFNKLQFLSPKALVHGYRWLDAISHEYMHYLIVKLTSNRAPIWFHEGLAKYEETRWRNGPGYLSPLSQTLLARALDEKRLIGFEKMEPSLVYLETPEEVQLAYAQAASAIEFILHRSGHHGLVKIMEHMYANEKSGAGDAIRDTMGIEFTLFERQWKDFLASKALQPVPGVLLRRYKVKEGEADENRMDLQEIKSMVARNRTHLGDIMKERGRLRAAVLEYKRALAEAPDSVPIMNRLAAALISLGGDAEALGILNRSVTLQPDNPTPYTQLGEIYTKRKDYVQAKEALETAIHINPFNPLMHLALVEIYTMLGDKEGAAKERRITDRLRR